MPKSSPPNRLSATSAAAIDWLVKLRDADISADDLDKFAEWLDADPDHAEAYANAEQLFSDIVTVARQSPATAAPIAEPVIRKLGLFKTLSTATAAALLIGGCLLNPAEAPWVLDVFYDYATGAGESREIKLTDGSLLLLNTNTALSLDFSASRRRVVLHHGQAHFVVAADPSREFEVLSGNLQFKALGTIFDVYKASADQTGLIVEEHAVAAALVDATPSDKKATVKVAAGESLNYRRGLPLPLPQRVDVEEATAWRRGQLIINDRPLAELLTELGRYRIGKVFPIDADIAGMRVTGVFSLHNPDETLQRICKALHLKANALGPWILLSRDTESASG